MMQNSVDRTFNIRPHFKQQNTKKFWSLIFATLIGVLGLAYYSGKPEFQAYAIGSIAFFVLFYFQSIKSRSALEGQEWPAIILSDDKLQIRQVGSLLWSKNIKHIISAEVEEKKLLFFSSKALLIKSSDKDSYYLNVPKPYSVEQSIETIAEEINRRAIS